MENIWLYEILGDAWGIVIAKDKREAHEKVREAYLKHDTSFNKYTPIEIKTYNEENNWFEDSPDILEVYG